MKDSRRVTLAWHIAHVALALVGLIGNLAYRKNYVETSKAKADAAVNRHIYRED